MRRLSNLALLTLLLATLAACGGGGGDAFVLAPDPDPTFEGEWHVVMLIAGGGGFNTGWGTATTDALGTMTTAVTTNEDGAITPGGSGTSVTTLAPDGTLTLVGGGDTVQGGITRAGDIAAVAALPGSTPFLGVFLRKAGAFGTASLNGAFHSVRMRRKLGLTGASGQRSGNNTYDGLGGTADTGGRPSNDDGVVVGSSYGSASYTVAADGTLTAGPTAGGVLAGAAAIVMAGRTGASSDPLMGVEVPKSVGATNALFSGDYALVGMQSDITPGPWRSTSARLQADGAGGGSVSGTQNIEGASAPFGPAAVTWSVAADGTLTMTLPGGDTVEGGIAPDGRLAILGGATQNGMDPAIFILVRVD